MITAGDTDVVLQSIRALSYGRWGAEGEYEWSQLSGPSVELRNADTEYASFTVPTVDEDATLEFLLNANYQNGVALSDTVLIRVVPRKTERVLAALIDFLDVDPEERPYNRQNIVNFLEDNDDSLSNFISHTSRELLSVDFDVLDWVTVNKNRTDYPLGGGPVIRDAVSRMSEFADLGEYDKVMLFVFPLEQGYPGCQAYLGKVKWNTTTGIFELGAAWLSGYNMGCVDKGRIAHEFGHTLGFMHSYSMDCEKEPPHPASLIDPTDKNNSCFNLRNSGDRWDAGIIANRDFDMLGGDHTDRYEDFFPVHFHATWQALAGWLTEDQVLTPSVSGDYWLTTLESLTPTPKAMKIPLGPDHLGSPLNYWLETREFNPCQVQVRLEAANLLKGRTGLPDTYAIGFPFDETLVREGWTFGLDKPFWDIHRGIRVDMLDCKEGAPGNPVRLKVSFTQLDVDPAIVAVFEMAGQATVTLTNNGSTPIDIGSASIGGRHPTAFSIGSDECSNGALEGGESCTVSVSHIPISTEDDSDSVHGVLKITSHDALAPELTVSLFGRDLLQ